jgi:hypothetical protein
MPHVRMGRCVRAVDHVACSGWRSDFPAARVAAAATADPKGAGGIPTNGRVHLAHSPNAAHFARDESATERRLARAVPAAGPGDLRGNAAVKQSGRRLVIVWSSPAVSVFAIRRLRRVPNTNQESFAGRNGGSVQPGTVCRIAAAARAWALKRMSRGRAGSDPSAPGVSHTDRQVQTPKLPPTELCIEPVPGRQLRRGHLRRSLTHARASL